MRIVSLIPSATEIVCAVGGQELLVGRSHECDFPEGVERLPVCTVPRLDSSQPSAEIDRQVKAALSNALAVYELKVDLLRELNPELIVTQSQCDVCAVSLADVEQAACEFLGSAVRIVSLQPEWLADVWNDIERVAAAMDRREQGGRIAGTLRERIADIRRRSAGVSRRPVVACIEWLEPLMVAGNWVPELVEIAGGQDSLGTPGEHSPWLKWDQLTASDPDRIVIMPCGFDIERNLQELPAIVDRSEWQSLRAVQEGHVYVTDGNQYFNRPGPRLVESAEILAEILHPDVFAFGHQGCGWTRLESTS